jgi:hypothetical protein
VGGVGGGSKVFRISYQKMTIRPLFNFSRRSLFVKIFLVIP